MDQLSGKLFLQSCCIIASEQEDMLLVKLAVRLLRHFQRFECHTVNEITLGKYRFVLRLSFKGDVFASNKVYLHRVKLFS